MWTASGFEVKQLSAKANGNEIGVRATNPDGITFLGFFFLFSEQAPMTSGKCLSGVMEPAKKENKKLKVESTTEFPSASGPTVDVTSYFVEGKPLHSVRAFVADQDICGDLEIYSDKPLSADSPEIKPILASYHLDREYAPQFKDAFLYAQLLYNQRMFKAAGPVYEVALSKLATASVPDAQTMRRMLTDQAGMSYGISGDTAKARAIFEQAVAKDPDYPMYYYNLACADAEERKLDDARKHLEQAFARKANVLPGEKMPDPTKDDSFLPHRGNKQFWAFVTSLQAKQ